MKDYRNNGKKRTYRFTDDDARAILVTLSNECDEIEEEHGGGPWYDRLMRSCEYISKKLGCNDEED